MSDSQTDFSLVSHRLGALPLLNQLIERLDLDRLLDRFVPLRDARERQPPALCLGLLLRNLALGKQPLYALAEWAQHWEPDMLGLHGQAPDLSDDRVGRALDRLFAADRASLLTEVVLRTVREFEVALSELHNDSTTITFSGAYASPQPEPAGGAVEAPTITRGHNKDHRPDLKQLVWALTVSADGSIPIHYRVWDGNTNDTVTHLPTWRTLVELVGQADFLYVADSKLCDKDTMAAIDADHGRFLTVLPRSRSEDRWFRHWLQTHEPTWQHISRNRHPRRKDGPESVWRGAESPLPSAEGYRIVWVWNSLMALDDADRRQGRLERTQRRLEELQARLQNPRSRIRERAAVEQALASALADAPGLFESEIAQTISTRLRKVGPGRPGADSLYRREEQARWKIEWKVNVDAVKAEARSDGMFPLITNDRQLSVAEVLAKYKYQPQLEKRHQALKSVLEVAPVWLKKPSRIEALLLLYYLALLVHALLERELKRKMIAADIPRLPLYPEGRLSAEPTAALLLALMDDLQTHRLFSRGAWVQTFLSDLSSRQRQVLELLDIDPDLLVDP